MDSLERLGALLAFALLVYLVRALLAPEKLS